MAEPIDERVLFAAQRAIARARGQEVFIEPMPDEHAPGTSAKLYRIHNTAEMEPVKASPSSMTDLQNTAPQKTVKATDRQRRNWLSGKSAEDAANVVVPRGVSSSAPPRCDPAARQAGIPVSASASACAPVSTGSSAPDPSLVSGGDRAPESEAPVKAEPSHERPSRRIREEESQLEAEVPYLRLTHQAFSPDAAIQSRTEAESCGIFLDYFFAQLKRCGVKNAVVSPGAHSTALACKAREVFGEVYVDSDTRSAAFFALGLAKATGNVVVLIGADGSSAASWMPAILEAQASRTPLLVLTADRLATMQGHDARGVCDQTRFFGDHVKRSFQMPLPSRADDALSFAKQTALDACIACHGCLPNVASVDAGPVHVNFPLAELRRPWSAAHKVPTHDFPAAVYAGHGLMPADARGLFDMICGKRVIALCGEGICGSESDARQLIDFAHARNVPLLADALSGLRSFSDSMIIDRYDAILGGEGIPHAEVVIRFGRWPFSDRLGEVVAAMNATQIVVDMVDCRDELNATDIFVHCSPVVFCETLARMESGRRASRKACRDWQSLNDLASCKVRDIKVKDDMNGFEGAYVYEVLESAPSDSLIWCSCGSSMLALDAFYCKSDKNLKVLANSGMCGIDGVLSSALGAAQSFEQSTVIIGDTALMHDINALSLQNEFRIRENHGAGKMPSVIIVLLNNCGAGSFDMLPMKSTEEYFERLLLNPQSVDFKRLADGFGVTCRTVSTVNTFRRTYSSLLGEPGINIIEVVLPLAGMAERFAEYRRI